MLRALPGQDSATSRHQPSQPTTTFNAAEDLEALGREPVGHEEEDDNKGGVQEAVTVRGFPLHVSMLGTLCLGSPGPLLRGCQPLQGKS